MNRRETTRFLGELLENRLNRVGKHYAKEVTVDYGSSTEKRIDYLEFQPPSGMFVGSIEKGIFVCYEVKSCIQDVYSGNGLNFLGERNYIVTTMETYKKLQPDIREGKLQKHIDSTNPESSRYFGIMVAVPEGRGEYEEFENPTSLDKDCDWVLKKIMQCNQGPRKRSITELMFCMIRSGK